MRVRLICKIAPFTTELDYPKLCCGGLVGIVFKNVFEDIERDDIWVVITDNLNTSEALEYFRASPDFLKLFHYRDYYYEVRLPKAGVTLTNEVFTGKYQR